METAEYPIFFLVPRYDFCFMALGILIFVQNHCVLLYAIFTYCYACCCCYCLHAKPFCVFFCVFFFFCVLILFSHSFTKNFPLYKSTLTASKQSLPIEVSLCVHTRARAFVCVWIERKSSVGLTSPISTRHYFIHSVLKVSVVSMLFVVHIIQIVCLIIIL